MQVRPCRPRGTPGAPPDSSARAWRTRRAPTAKRTTRRRRGRRHRDSRTTVRGDVPTASWRRRNETQVRRSRALIFCRSVVVVGEEHVFEVGFVAGDALHLECCRGLHERIGGSGDRRAQQIALHRHGAHARKPSEGLRPYGPPKRISTTRSAFASISRTWSTATRLSGANDRDPVHRTLHLCKHMRRKKHRRAISAHLSQQRTELALHDRIETTRRLVQHEQLRAMHERLNDPELLAVPSRQRPDRLRQVTGESFGELLAVGDVVTTTQMHQVGQHLHAGQLVVQRKIPGQIPDAAPQPRTRTPRITTPTPAPTRPKDATDRPTCGSSSTSPHHSVRESRGPHPSPPRGTTDRSPTSRRSASSPHRNTPRPTPAEHDMRATAHSGAAPERSPRCPSGTPTLPTGNDGPMARIRADARQA